MSDNLKLKIMKNKINKEKRLGFRVDEDFYLTLLNESNKRGIKISQLIRELLVEGLEK